MLGQPGFPRQRQSDFRTSHRAGSHTFRRSLDESKRSRLRGSRSKSCTRVTAGSWRSRPTSGGARWHEASEALGLGHPIDGKYANPGYTTLLQPDGPIYFIGDHVSYLVGWQEGAALSSLRAVGMLAERVKAIAQA